MSSLNSFHFKATESKKQPSAVTIDFAPEAAASEWLRGVPGVEDGSLRREWEEKGVVTVRGLLSEENVNRYLELYDGMVSGDIDAKSHRHDLGSNQDQQIPGVENITQIMWPSDYILNDDRSPLHQRTLALAKHLLGEHIVFDFDMLIFKAPHTNTPTPFHQDEAYWGDMPDKTAVSCWVALDEATLDNGCMWHVHGAHKGALAKHAPAAAGSHVITAVDPVFTEADAVPAPLRAGDVVLHHGRTPHYTRGNSTDTKRRAYITNYRPEKMVQWERQQGLEHGRGGMDKVDYSALPLYASTTVPEVRQQ